MEILYRYRDYLSTYSITTQKTYLECVNLYLNYLKEVYGKVNVIIICNVTEADIFNYLAYMEGLSKNSKKIRIYALKNFYSYLKIRQDLFEDIKLYNYGKKVPYSLTSSQCKQLINYYHDKRNRLIIYLFLTTGIRLNELAEIIIDNVDFVNKSIKIMCKGRVERVVLINDKCRDMIQDYATEGKLFKIGKAQIRNIVENAMKSLGYKGTPHTLRHSFASIMYQETHDIRLVQELLGHKSILSTQIYTHINSEQVKNAVESNPLANYGGIKWKLIY